MNRTVNRWRTCALALACAVSLGCACAAVAGDGVTPDRLAALEAAFWTCDYIGTTQGVAEAPVTLCVEVTQVLRDERFGGDFDALCAWWRQNKARQHAKIAAELLPVANR